MMLSSLEEDEVLLPNKEDGLNCCSDEGCGTNP
jgi:hypothetical protein